MSQCWCWSNLISNLRFELGSEDFWFLGYLYIDNTFFFLIVGDPFNVDIQGLGKTESVQELGRQARPTLDLGRGGCFGGEG